MPQFWGYKSNGKYAIGCTGQTVYVYDSLGKELARFKDIKYAYTPMFCPGTHGHEAFIVKSTAGQMAVYSLGKMKLIKKFRFSKVNYAQDDGFCFSKDGKFLYNIERHVTDLRSCLSVYETETFNLVSQHCSSEGHFRLELIEYDIAKNGFFVLGCSFVAKFEMDKLVNITKIPPEQYRYTYGYKKLELLGFTSKAKEWSSLWYDGYDLEQLRHVNLSEFWEV